MQNAVFPFGSPLRAVVQDDRKSKRVFVLGVYASAVHARWYAADGKLLVRAMAVASEPVIFWTGADAPRIVATISVPEGAGHLEPADQTFNGPSGRALDEEFLRPLQVGRQETWLCDLVPHACLNPAQRKALKRTYEPRAERLRLPPVSLPAVPKAFADENRRRVITAEVDEADPEIIVLLGDQPIRHWLRAHDRRWSRLSDFGTTPSTYGRVHNVSISNRVRQILPLAHPRQVAALGTHAVSWRTLHAQWKPSAATLLRVS